MIKQIKLTYRCTITDKGKLNANYGWHIILDISSVHFVRLDRLGQDCFSKLHVLLLFSCPWWMKHELVSEVWVPDFLSGRGVRWRSASQMVFLCTNQLLGFWRTSSVRQIYHQVGGTFHRCIGRYSAVYTPLYHTRCCIPHSCRCIFRGPQVPQMSFCCC